MRAIDLALPPLAPPGPQAVIAFLRRDPLFAGTAAIIAASMVPVLVAAMIDDRSIDGVGVWIKPLKFQLALTIYLATLAWFSGWMPARLRAGRAWRSFAIVVVACIAAELAWIGGAAAQGVASHFNIATPLRQALYTSMGGAAVMLTSASLVQGIAILRARTDDGGDAPRLAIGLGLVLTFVLTVPIAGYLSGVGGPFVGVDPGSVRRLAFLGWARNGGDLRVAHFLATHALHAVPLLGFVAARLTAPRHARRIVAVGAASYAALVVWSFAQALGGRPFLPWLG